MTSFGGHFGILPIERVTYGCQSGNQTRIVLKWPQYKNINKSSSEATFLGSYLWYSAVKSPNMGFLN